MISTDLLWAYRSLVRSKGFFATAVATLGLALGLCTTTFAVIDGLRHPWTPIVEPDRVMLIRPNGRVRDSRASVYERFRMVRAQTHFADDLGLVITQFSTARVGDRDYTMNVQAATPNFLRILGIKPDLGRWFDSTAGPDASVVITQGAWQTWFPKATSLDGVTITLSNRIVSVIGVIPLPYPAVFVALPPDRPPVPPNAGGALYARLKPGVSRDDAHREMSVLARQLSEQFDPVNRSFSFVLSDMAPRPVGGLGFDVLFGAVGVLVLVIACTNLAGMMLARGIARRRDIALRLALGATRRAIIRQLLTEALVIAGAGCIVGIPVAIWGLYIVIHEVPRRIWFVGTLEMHLSWRVFAFAIAAAATVGVVVGVLPGLRASQVNLDEPLKEGSSSTTGRRRQKYSALAIAELSMAMTLLMGTGLMVRSALLVSAYDFGFNPRHLVMAQFALWTRYDSMPKVPPTISRLLDVASRVKGVKAVAVLSGGACNFPAQVIPDKVLPDGKLVGACVGHASAGFQDVLGLPLLSGRGFEPGDNGTPVAIVDQSAGRALFLGEDPIGHTVKVGSWMSKQEWVRIVGVVADAELGFRGDADYPHTPVIYLPPANVAEQSARILARVSGNDAVVASAVAREVQTTFAFTRRPAAASFVAMTGQEGYEATQIFVAVLFSVFGAVALGLAAVGLYAVVAYAVAQRMREFAVRAALGAGVRDLFRLAAHDGAVMTLAGTGIGAFIAMAVAMKLGRFLWGLYPIDAISLVSAEFALCSVAFLACLGPARRAMTADPAEILRAV